MADKFYAATKIKFGKRSEDGSQDGKYEQIIFEVDDEVTGLDKDTMKDLWNAGALRREKAGSADDESQEKVASPPAPKKATTPKVDDK